MQTILFFDIDLTLVHNQFSNQLLRDILDEVVAASGKAVEVLASELNIENSRRQEHDPDNLLTMDWDDIARHIARQYNVELSRSVDQLWLEYANADTVLVLDNAPDVLKKLKADHRTLVIATKGLSKYQDVVLDTVGLRPYFDDILTPDKTGFLKTSPAFFDKYNKQDGLFIHIGDHYYDDVICAKRNGFYSVMRAPIAALEAYDPFDRPKVLEQHLHKIATYPQGGTDVRPDAVIISLQELPDVVQQIEAQHS